ncbi:MAG: amidohydrolase [Chloroflexi bacterium]|nr:amidohydrolase [Chloroflexota bacterium]
MLKILFNARIYTFDKQKSTAAALAVRDGRIVALDAAAEMAAAPGEKVERFDLQGRTLIPGLTDAHIHLEHYAFGLQKVDCETATRAECLARVKARAEATPPGEWVLGHGWNQNNWALGMGNPADLDTVTPRHPAYLTAKSLHAGWANSLALAAAGVHSNTPDPPGGRLGRDASGKPDGLLYESAMRLVENSLPEPSDEQAVQAIGAALPGLARMGLTGVHDFDRRRCFAALQLLRARGQLSLRVLKSIPLEDLRHAASLGLRSGFGDDWLRIGGVKAFADGALGPRTAAMLQPYQGEAENRGMLLLDAEELFDQGRLAVENGYNLAVHAIGDRAVHEVLDAFEQLREYEEARMPRAGRPLRHRIEHVQVIHGDDAARLAKLGVIASMQPIHAPSDMLMADRYWGERAALSYAWRTQLDYGARLAFGSDAPVESPNPFWGVHAAVTRRRLDGSPGVQGWYPEQRLKVDEALLAYTQGAAYAAGMEDRLGRLREGFYADLLALETDPFTCAAEELANLRPAGTMIHGEWAFLK